MIRAVTPIKDRIGEKDAAHPAVQGRTAPPQPGHELKGPERHEENPGKDVRQREGRVAREAGLEVHGGPG